MTAVRVAPALAMLGCLTLLLVAAPAGAQLAAGPGMGGQGVGGRGGHHGGGQRQRSPQAAALAPLPPVRDPWPRLDAGALLCRTEADLQQHQAAVAARLTGSAAPEPPGCQIMHAMTAVSVVERHEPARTEVRLPGPPEQLGWTDVAISQEPPPSR